MIMISDHNHGVGQLLGSAEEMHRNLIGSSGVSASVMGLGCSKFGSVSGTSGRAAAFLLQHAFDLGVNLFDTANIYGQGESERLIG